MPGAAEHQLPVAVTIGDPLGIGPDVTLAAWQDRAQLALPPFALYGARDVLEARAHRLGLGVPIETIASLREAPAAVARALPLLPVGRRASKPSADALVLGAVE